MRTIVPRVAGMLLVAAALGSVAGTAGREPSASGPRRPEFEYLEAVNRVAPPSDPELLFILMGQYANANLQAEAPNSSRHACRSSLRVCPIASRRSISWPSVRCAPATPLACPCGAGSAG